jgi:C1A family cysteine protease
MKKKVVLFLILAVLISFVAIGFFSGFWESTGQVSEGGGVLFSNFWNVFTGKVSGDVGVLLSVATLKDDYFVGESIKLTDPPLKLEQVKELAELNEDKINEDKKLNRLKRQDRETLLKGLNLINPVQLIKKLFIKISLNLQERKLERAESKLQLVLQTYDISRNLQERFEEINNKTNTWIANYNSMSIPFEGYEKKFLGLKISEETNLDSLETIPSSDISLPDFFDWRNQHGENYITSVKDQGGCGSSWAFASNAVLEGTINAYYNNPNLDVDLSEQDLISCYQDLGCEGIFDSEFEEVLDYYKNGISEEVCFEYSAVDGDCEKCSDDPWKITSYQSSDLSVDGIKRTLIENGPVVVGMKIYTDFPFYDGGIYSPTTSNILGHHAVTIVGFGKDDGQDYWIVKNSWGEDWGEEGYFKIFSGQCLIDSWFAYAVDKPISPIEQESFCNDKDGDNYCNWGLGDKPEDCSCLEDVQDCNDFDKNIFEGCGKSVNDFGALSVKSNIDNSGGAKVYVADKKTGDWIYRGKTPLEINLEIGKRKVKVSGEGADDYVGSVKISKEEASSFFAELELGLRFSPLETNVFLVGDLIELKGTVPRDLKNYFIEYSPISGGQVEWSKQGIRLENNGALPVSESKLAVWDTSLIAKSNFYTLRLIVNYQDGSVEGIFLRNIYLKTSSEEVVPQFSPDEEAGVKKVEEVIGGGSNGESENGRPQSKIVNNGGVSLNGNLIIRIQKKVGFEWQDHLSVLNQAMNIPTDGLVKLDNLFNPKGVSVGEGGVYRIYSTYLTESASWEFNVADVNDCGNAVCDEGESCVSCSQDCGDCCGNGVCDNDETTISCLTDCGECLSDWDCDGGYYCDNSICILDLRNCGDGEIDNGEDCDGSKLDGKICINLGYDEGYLTCNSNCTFDISDCVHNPFSGDYTGPVQIDYTGFEECDLDNVWHESLVANQGWNYNLLMKDFSSKRDMFGGDGGVCFIAISNTIEVSQTFDFRGFHTVRLGLWLRNNNMNDGDCILLYVNGEVQGSSIGSSGCDQNHLTLDEWVPQTVKILSSDYDFDNPVEIKFKGSMGRINSVDIDGIQVQGCYFEESCGFVRV